MTNSTLTLLQHRLLKLNHKGSISPQATVICELIDEANHQHWYDRNSLAEEVKLLKARIVKLEAKGQA